MKAIGLIGPILLVCLLIASRPKRQRAGALQDASRVPLPSSRPIATTVTNGHGAVMAAPARALADRAVLPQTNRPIIEPPFIYPAKGSNYWWHLLTAEKLPGPWRTNVKNLRLPATGTMQLSMTGRIGFMRMLGTTNQLP